jgi:uncharacterized repeat protein (TIGR01451 family)
MVLALLVALAPPVSADLRSAPAWWDQNAVGTAPDWHYRVAVNVPATATVNSTIRVDIDFNAQLALMGISGTFDVNSPRVIRPTGIIATTQEFTDTVYAGATDAANNGRGEVRFILQDAGPATYYVYFDITQNGAKAANPQTPINGNFERGATGTAQPASWNAPSGDTNLDAQVRPSENPTITTDGTGAAPNPKTTNGTPNTGAFSYLIGARTNNEVGDTTRTITRTFTVPATNPGNFTVRWRTEGWDSTGFDTLAIRLTSGGTTVNVVGPAVGNYATAPYSPNLGGGTQSTTASGYLPYNNFDMTSTGAHTAGMTVAAQAEPWWTRSVSLAPLAGQTVTLTITSTHIHLYRAWFHIDDVEWSLVDATLGTPQGYGVNILSPSGATLTKGATVSLLAQVDANPTAATTPVTAEVYDTSGTLQRTAILFNDGTHGDTTAGDATWANDGSVPADKLNVPPGASGSGWVLRVLARDASTSTIGVQNGLVRGPGTGAAPVTQANFWNVDEYNFAIATGPLTVAKTSSIVSDPFRGTTNPKRIPGSTVRYCILVSNTSNAAVTTVVVKDSLPAEVLFISGSMRSGTTCAGAATVEDDNATGTDESDPIGANFAAGVITATTASLAANSSIALTADVTVK